MDTDNSMLITTGKGGIGRAGGRGKWGVNGDRRRLHFGW